MGFRAAKVVVSEFAAVGMDQDGQDCFVSRYQVIAEDREGNREVHSAEFDDYYGAAQNLCDRIMAADRDLNLDHWCRTDPCYGSAAYLVAEPALVDAEIMSDLEGR